MIKKEYKEEKYDPTKDPNKKLSKIEQRAIRLKLKPQVEWKSHRKKVELDSLMYEDPYTRDYISTYLDFHGRNEHCTTPRPSRDTKELG
jgi:hypothetical protein